MADSYQPYAPDTWPHPRSGMVYIDELLAAQLKRRKFTVTEFYRMVPACILGEDTLEELIDGDIMVRALKTRPHSHTISKLFRLLLDENSPDFVPIIQCPVRLDNYNEPIVDMALIAADSDSKDEHPGPKDMLLAIEIADTSDEAEYDSNIKLPVYARYGIPELWLVKLQSGIVEVHREPTPEGYADVQRYGKGETLTIQALPNVRIATGDVLQ